MLASFLLAGCFATTPQVSYYSLYAPAQKPAPVATMSGSLAVSVGPVTTPDILKQEKIATGGADGRYHMAEYHRWSGELDRDFARAIAEQLSGNLGTEKVAIFPWDQTIVPSCRVIIDVLNMGGEPGKTATLAVRWTLVKPGAEQPILVRRSELSDVPADASYATWVAAQQRNLAKFGQEIAAAIRENVKP
jgi:uncharacterized lipoprotein YmbA